MPQELKTVADKDAVAALEELLTQLNLDRLTANGDQRYVVFMERVRLFIHDASVLVGRLSRVDETPPK